MSNDTQDKPRSIELGDIFIISDVFDEVRHREICLAIERHRRCDWGLALEFERLANELALTNGLPITSTYRDSKNKQFLIITKGDRSETTVRFPF